MFKAKWTADELAILARNPTGRVRDVRRKLADAGFTRDNEAVRNMRKRLQAQEVEACEYAPGHFTEVVRKPSKACPDGWPPRFESEWMRPKGYHSSLLLSAYATANKEAGKGHAGIALNLPGAAKVKPKGVK